MSDSKLRPYVVRPKAGEEKDFSMTRFSPVTDDFFFWQDFLVILHPFDAVWEAPVLARSTHSLEEHIRFVEERQIRKALVVAEDISFLRECPGLAALYIMPAYGVQGTFDYSPLYDLPRVEELRCRLTTGAQERLCASVDYRRFPHLKRLYVEGTQGHIGLEDVKGLTHLSLHGWKPKEQSLAGLDASALEEIDLCQCGLRSLAGLEKAARLRKASISNCRTLTDASALAAAGGTLTSLDIEACGRIGSFAWLHEMTALTELTLTGSNTLPDLSFLANMKKLRTFRCTMNVADGDLSLCRGIPCVHIRNRKHYNLTDRELPKGG